MLLYAKMVAGRAMLHVLPDSGSEYALQASIWKKRGARYCLLR
jgi:hypothetical protein